MGGPAAGQPTLHGGPVVIHPIRATPCFYVLLANLLGVPSYGQRVSQPPDCHSVQFELLGLKWLSRISVAVAKELTPYEVGDRHWQASIHTLSSGDIGKPAYTHCHQVIMASQHTHTVIR